MANQSSAEGREGGGKGGALEREQLRVSDGGIAYSCVSSSYLPSKFPLLAKCSSEGGP